MLQLLKTMPPPAFLAGIEGLKQPRMNLDEVLAKKRDLKNGGICDLSSTRSGGVTRDEATGDTRQTGFTVFTPEHERIMRIFEANTISRKKEEEGSCRGSAPVKARDWAAMAALLPEYGLSVALLSSLLVPPETAKAFAWNVTEGKYSNDESLAAAATAGAGGSGALNVVQLAKDMEHKPGGGGSSGVGGHLNKPVTRPVNPTR